MIELPKGIKPAETINPTSMIIYSSPKVGKTAAVAKLGEKALLVDIEEGSREVEAQKVRISNLEELKELIKAIKKQGKPYPIGVLDTLSKLEELALPYAKQLYKETPMGKNFDAENKGIDVLSLPRGAGYYYLRLAVLRIMEGFSSAFDHVIYTAHLKDSSLERAGKEVNVQDISLTGLLRTIVPSRVSAIGYMYRKKNQTILSFFTDGSAIAGARSAHIRNKEIVILESDETGELISHGWDQVYLGLDEI